MRPHWVSARRLRENHKWSEAQSREPWAVLLRDMSGVLVIPKSLRFAAPEVLRQTAVAFEDAAPKDDADFGDDAQEWVLLGNSGKGKVIWRYDSWTTLAFESKSADWLKKGIAAAIVVRPNAKRAAIEPGPDANQLVAALNDCLCWWTNPTTRRPVLTAIFNPEGELDRDQEPETKTPSELLAASRAAYEEALERDDEAEAAVARAAAPAGPRPVKLTTPRPAVANALHNLGADA